MSGMWRESIRSSGVLPPLRPPPIGPHGGERVQIRPGIQQEKAAEVLEGHRVFDRHGPADLVHRRRPFGGRAKPAPSSALSMDTSAQTQENAVVKYNALPVDAVADYVRQLKNEVTSLPKFDVENYTGSKDGLQIGAALFILWTKLAADGNALSLNANQRMILSDFKSQVSGVQAAAFPRMRDAFGPIWRKVFQKADVNIRTVGPGYRTIEVIGAAFADDQMKKEFTDLFWKTLHIFRFKRLTFKWHKDADDYTYDDIKSPDDRDLVTWEQGTRWRKVE